MAKTSWTTKIAIEDEDGLGNYACERLDRCPKCGGNLDYGSDSPTHGNESQFCIGGGTDEEEGCGFMWVYEHIAECDLDPDLP